ncbi:uncharacterized protein G2W53_037833 [Senna tora]|uniref:Uncharacterized protein n=1 Tax=Senna tora TaxID=362788 RepID=A0A834W1D7_9FABA|nr:uncharacterized protein G2W53_037833 [Senna tora]
MKIRPNIGKKEEIHHLVLHNCKLDAKSCNLPEPRGLPLLRLKELPKGEDEKPADATAVDRRFLLKSFFRGLPLFLFNGTSEPTASDFSPATPIPTGTDSVTVLVVFAGSNTAGLIGELVNAEFKD